MKLNEKILYYRKAAKLSQEELAELVGVSRQAVSKWERGEALPDTALLVDLAEALETTVDFILTGGERALAYKGKVTISSMVEGLRCLESMGRLLGRENLIYRHAVRGIDEGMNTEIETAFIDERVFECFVAEAVIQNLKAGAYVDPVDVRLHFKEAHFRDIVLEECKKHGIC